MISNVLDQFLNESTTGYGYNVEKPEPLSESESFFISPDSNGIALLKEQDERDLRKLDMARSGMRNMRVSMVVYIRCVMRNGKRSSLEETYTAISANCYWEFLSVQ